MKIRLFAGIAATTLLATTVLPVTNSLSFTKRAQTQKVQASTTTSAFLTKAASQAQKASKKYGVYPSVMIAQAIVESAWGTSGLATKANNLFGMKADDGWSGATYSARTREEVNGQSVYITARFRKYSNWEASFEDNGKKLRNGVSWDADRYAGAWIEKASSYKAATKALTGTYATASNYNTILNSRISAYNLTKYDPKISKTSKKYYAAMNAKTYQWPTNHSVSKTKSSIVKGKTYTATKTITYYNGTQRMYLKGKGWVNSTVLTTTNPNPTSTQAASAIKDFTTTTATKKTLMHNAYVYDSTRTRVSGTGSLKAFKKLNTYGYITISGKKYYKIANNQYVAAGNFDGSTHSLKHNAYVYNGSAKRTNNRVYKKGTSLKTYGSAVTIKGKKYYVIGVRQYVKKNNF